MTRNQREALDAMLRHAPLDLGGEVREQRRLFAEMMSAAPTPGDVRTQEGALGGVPVVEIGIEGQEPRGVILYFHGGAYAIGTAGLAVGLASDLARRSGARAVSVEYRLAPEHPYPAAVEDAVAAYRALLESGVAASDVVFAGESAGAGLAVVALLALQDAELPQPAGSYLASPWVDLAVGGASAITHAAVDPSVTAEGLRRRSGDYLRDHDPHDGRVSPVFADLRGLPPMLIQVGGNEVLLDDSTRLAARAAASQVAVTLQVTPEVPHVFVAFAALLDEADRALDTAGAFLRERLGGRAASRSGAEPTLR